jgi:hypothetical protein
MRVVEAGSVAPSFAVVLVAESGESIADVLAHLARQTVVQQVEVVVATPARESVTLDPARPAPFASVQLVEVTSAVPLGAARAEALQAARAPVVFLGETHTFAAPSFVEALLEAHRGPWAAVAPAIGNANPETARSWACFLPDYGAWFAPEHPGEIDAVPSYNAAFKRELLLGFGDRLPDLLEPTSDMRDELSAAGHRFAIEPRAELLHLNVTTPRAWLSERYLHGRLIGGHRAERWPLSRRLVYAAGSPLLPVVLTLRLRRELGARWPARALPRFTSALLVLGMTVSAAGELIGYLAGRGSAPRRMARYELDKQDFVPKATGVS